jgi:hypothetical protein
VALIPAPATPAPQERGGPALPPPTGVVGHWRYTLGAWEWFRTWRKRVSAEDTVVREAVDARDLAFVALGEAARALAATSPDDTELVAFAATLSRFDDQAGSLGARNEELRQAAERARADTAAAVAGFDTRLSALRAEAAPLEAAATGVKQRLEVLERQQIALAARNARARDAAIAVDLERNEVQRQALREELSRHEAAVSALRRRADALTEEQRLVEKAGEREAMELIARADRALNEGGQLADRRRATLMDLGHEALRRGLDHASLRAPMLAARTALQHLDAARLHREGVLAERRDIDLAPCLRTLAAAGLLMIGLMLLVFFV